MPVNKIIYGKGRAPRPSEFSAGDIIINVDDAKVYSKNKSNTVFEIGAGTGLNFSSASFSTGSVNFDVTASEDYPRLVFSASTGISFVQGSEPNSVLIAATGEAIAVNADTASYVAAGNIDGDINIITQTNLSAGSGLSFSGNTLNVNTGTGLEFSGDDLAVEDIYLRNNANDSTTGTLTAANIHTNGIVKLIAQNPAPSAVAGGMYYGTDDDFYLGFSS